MAHGLSRPAPIHELHNLQSTDDVSVPAEYNQTSYLQWKSTQSNDFERGKSIGYVCTHTNTGTMPSNRQAVHKLTLVYRTTSLADAVRAVTLLSEFSSLTSQPR